jgi:hypothetical protein
MKKDRRRTDMDVIGITRESYKPPIVEQSILKTPKGNVNKLPTSSELMVLLLMKCGQLTSVKKQGAMKESKIDTYA